MGSVTVDSVITKARYLLQDDGLRWTTAELRKWVSDAQGEIALTCPDASYAVASLALVAGSTQTVSLPATAITGAGTPPTSGKVVSLVDVYCDTSSPRAVRRVKREILDDQIKTWHSDAIPSGGSLQFYTMDERYPTDFFVYPNAISTTKLNAAFSFIPDTSTTTLGVSDRYANAVLDYVMHRAYSKDAEYASNTERAKLYLTAFTNTLGVIAKQIAEDKDAAKTEAVSSSK